MTTDLQHQEALSATTTTIATAAVVTGDNQTALPIIRQLLDGCVETEEQKFLREFENRVLDLVREVDRQFPYKQTILWSIEYAENKGYCIHVMSNRHHHS